MGPTNPRILNQAKGGQARQPPEPLTYKGRYVFEIIRDMLLGFVVK
jgi:hypothetical protein